MKAFFNFFNKVGDYTSNWLLLVVRLYWGILFAQAGWGKLQDLSKPIAFFAKLGIPYPELHAPLVGYTEFIGGILLAVGLFSRIVSIPLIITMVVALIVAHGASLGNLAGIVKETPFNFLLASLIVLSFGAGKFSLDYLFGVPGNKSK
ncbi:MAG: DoxX family protein [Chlamydiia bacterium]|nr:DoxX family protein [Chlamydiia bacterium]